VPFIERSSDIFDAIMTHAVRRWSLPRAVRTRLYNCCSYYDALL
jgi:hypothetical protein